jgi:hypothetical protein
MEKYLAYFISKINVKNLRNMIKFGFAEGSHNTDAVIVDKIDEKKIRDDDILRDTERKN